MSGLAQIEATFTNALLDVGIPAPPRVRGGERRFAVYRNNFSMGLLTALSSRFPVVKRLVGDDFFRELCRRYIAVEPPRSPILLYYGETFPAFIDGFEHASAIPYLGAIARIELARGQAYHAADVKVFSARDFAALDPDRIADLQVTLHPSVSIISSDFPIYSIWKVNQNRAPVVPVSPWAGEDALVARPHNVVQLHKLENGEAAFLHALAKDYSLAQAISASLESVADFDTAKAMAMLIDSKIVVGFKKATDVLRH